MITTTDPGGLVKIVTLTKHENIQTDQHRPLKAQWIFSKNTFFKSVDQVEKNEL